MPIAQMHLITEAEGSVAQDNLETRLKANLAAQAVEVRALTIEQLGREWRLSAEVELPHLVVVVCSEVLELFRQLFPSGFREISSQAAA